MSNSSASNSAISNSATRDNVGSKGTFAALAGLLPFLKPYRRQFVLAGIALLVAASATLVIPYAFKQMIDHGFGAAAGGKSIANVNATFLALFGVAAVLGVATAARFYMVSWLGERVTADIRSAVYGHVVRQSPEFFETTRTGEVLSRLTTDTTLIQAWSAPASRWRCAIRYCSSAAWRCCS
jgi:ATP-binding cassette subfamily B protein